MIQNYSVLMSVYYKEKPDFLREAMKSILHQSVPTDDFVLICDGPLTPELDSVILDMQAAFGEVLHVFRLEKNVGLGNALNFGLKQCRNELVARMDSDDISLPDRITLELEVFEKYPELSIVSGTIEEFSDSPEKITGLRKVPESHADIVQFSKTRNPFNHPCVLFKKTDIEKVGGYDERFPLFEDYYLWVRLLQSGYKGRNLQTPLLLMRTPAEMYLRRGGAKYAKDLLAFYRWLKQTRWIGMKELLFSALPHAMVCVLPNGVRKFIYKKLHK